MKTIHLVGHNRQQAKPANEIKVGDVLVWNFGYYSWADAISPAKSMINFTTKSLYTGAVNTRRMKGTR